MDRGLAASFRVLKYIIYQSLFSAMEFENGKSTISNILYIAPSSERDEDRAVA